MICLWRWPVAVGTPSHRRWRQSVAPGVSPGINRLTDFLRPLERATENVWVDSRYFCRPFGAGKLFSVRVTQGSRPGLYSAARFADWLKRISDANCWLTIISLRSG